MAAAAALEGLWRAARMDPLHLRKVVLSSTGRPLPSSFAVADAAQASLGAAALAAAVVGASRGAAGARVPQVAVDREHVVLETTGRFWLDGVEPPVWDPLSGLYRCGGGGGGEGEGDDDGPPPGWVRIHANFAHHRDAALELLGCPLPPSPCSRDDVAAALRRWRADGWEEAAAAGGAVASAMRTFDEWDRHPQAAAVAAEELVSIERVGDAPPLPLPPVAQGDGPLRGVRVLDLTRILSGPVAARTLANFGADVMMVSSPNLPHISAVADTSRGKLSCHLDLERPDDVRRLHELVRDDCRVFLQAYRPGSLARRGLAPEDLARVRPGIVAVSLSAWGFSGPWSGRRGFDSIVQTGTGFNAAEADALGSAAPRPLPVQILDFAAGYLLAFGALVALDRQTRQGGSWHVRVSLARVGVWLRSLGRVPRDVFARPDAGPPEPRPEFLTEDEESGFGRLRAVRSVPTFDGHRLEAPRPSPRVGAHEPLWPA